MLEQRQAQQLAQRQIIAGRVRKRQHADAELLQNLRALAHAANSSA